MTNLDTGDNEPKHGDLLLRIVKQLCSERYMVVNPFKDQENRVYAYMMKDPHGFYFYLTAKGSRLYGNVLSCQKTLAETAKERDKPLIIGWLDPEDPPELQLPKFYMFNPHDVDLAALGVNIRLGCEMINFPIDLGLRFYPEQKVEDAYRKIKGKQTTLDTHPTISTAD
jgi:hypothetical protein